MKHVLFGFVLILTYILECQIPNCSSFGNKIININKTSTHLKPFNILSSFQSVIKCSCTREILYCRHKSKHITKFNNLILKQNNSQALLERVSNYIKIHLIFKNIKIGRILMPLKLN